MDRSVQNTQYLSQTFHKPRWSSACQAQTDFSTDVSLMWMRTCLLSWLLLWRQHSLQNDLHHVWMSRSHIYMTTVLKQRTIERKRDSLLRTARGMQMRDVFRTNHQAKDIAVQTFHKPGSSSACQAQNYNETELRNTTYNPIVNVHNACSSSTAFPTEQNPSLTLLCAQIK